LISYVGFAQQGEIIRKTIWFSGDTLEIDQNPIIVSSFKIKHLNQSIPETDVFLDPIKTLFYYKNAFIDSIPFSIEYEVLPLQLNTIFKHKSDSLIFRPTDTASFETFLFSTDTEYESIDFFGDSQLEKQGSISRGVSIGNAQNLSFQSTLNLQLNGKIGPNLFIKGSISDDNIPFQPDGNTQKLQEFDQVFLQIYNDDFAVTGGDFWLNKPYGYFLNYQKRTQGLSIDYNHLTGSAEHEAKVNHKVSGAFSRGKFGRSVIQGVEGNQGPYKLYGAENEQNIIVLAGTEKIYIDGILLKRGQAFDYTINYNSAEITFTANQLITKDKRLIIEFQYSDLNYARSLFAYNTKLEASKYTLWFNYYSEQDAKNQSIQQDLNLEQKQVLSLIGDSLSNAFLPSIRQVDFNQDRIMYTLIDSLGYDSILVFSNIPTIALYEANFRFVGNGNGNYTIDKYTANGKIYRWIAPVSGIPQGDYEPIQLLIPPKKKQMLTVGGSYQLSKQFSAGLEMAMSNTDLNTFSNEHNRDDKGYALKWHLEQKKKFKTNNQFNSRLSFELNDKNFEAIQWFRSPEFDRDWNVRNTNFTGNQYISTAEVGFSKSGYGRLSLRLNQLTWGEDYSGLKTDLITNYNRNGTLFDFKGNYLFSEGLTASRYLKHQSTISKSWKKLSLGVKDIFERNQIFDGESIQPVSFQFYDIKSFISTGDSTGNYYELYFQKRYDWHPDSIQLNFSAEAENIGFTTHFLKRKSNRLKLNVNYRRLHIIQQDLINQSPENTVLGRLEHNLFMWKGTITSRTFYEINSGLELKREFIYVQVNSGQGVYTWVDYNDDGVKDLGEFEIAQFTDQAEYIRVSIVSNDYVRTYGNQLAQSIFIRPERVFRTETGIKKIISLFSNQTVFKINRKTNYESGLSAFNPIQFNIADTSLIQTNSNFRNTIYFNRLDPKFGLEYEISTNSSKYVLTNGSDLNDLALQKVKMRWNIAKSYNLRLELNTGNKISRSEYAQNRNYNFEISSLKSSLAYQPNTKLRIALLNEYAIKLNNSDIKEEAKVNEIGTELRYNQAQKGSLSANFSYFNIKYNALSNTPLAFEMLNALKPGLNFTWGMTYQRKVAENLQLNFNYSGRKSENTSFIHTGGMEIRAFF